MPSRVPKIVLVGGISQELFKCDMCHKVFITKSYLSKHAERRHLVVNQLEENHEVSHEVPINLHVHGVTRTETNKNEENFETDLEMAWCRERKNWLLKLEEKMKELGIYSKRITDSTLHSILTTIKFQVEYLYKDDNEVTKAWRREVKERLSRSIEAQVTAQLLAT